MPRQRATPRLVVLAALAALPACAAPASRAPAAATYANPVLDADFPDPTVVRASDGAYYAYATQGERDGASLNIQVARSRALAAWEQLGDALPTNPTWASATRDFWAPHVSEHDGTFYLYYSAKPDAALQDTTRGLCLAVAASRSPAGPFTDVGAPLQCGAGFVTGRMSSARRRRRRPRPRAERGRSRPPTPRDCRGPP